VPPDIVFIYTEDITEEKTIERALKEEEEKNREIYERSQIYLKVVGVMVLVLDDNFIVISINPKGCDIMGYSEEEIVGQPWFNFVPEKVKNGLLTVKDSQVIKDEEISYYENPILNKDGEERMIAWYNSTHLDEKGEVLYYVSSGEDVTEKQQDNEKRFFLHQLLRHDVRNKAFIAQSFLDLVLETDLTEEQLNFIQKSKNALTITSDLVAKVKDLLNIVEEHEIFKINLKTILIKAVNAHEDLAEERGIKIILISNEEIIVQAGDLLFELLSNLVENAVKHSNATIIKITTEITDSNEVKVVIDDNGRGISQDIEALLFNRNVKSRESTGSGLGLYLCKSIAQKYEGDIEFCDSSLGGACFRLTLNLGKIEK
jgi:PAS domain S-box-containing protein